MWALGLLKKAGPTGVFPLDIPFELLTLFPSRSIRLANLWSMKCTRRGPDGDLRKTMLHFPPPFDTLEQAYLLFDSVVLLPFFPSGPHNLGRVSFFGRVKSFSSCERFLIELPPLVCPFCLLLSLLFFRGFWLNASAAFCA